MSVRGSQETVSLADLLELIHSTGRAGAVSLRIGSRKVTLYVYRSQIYLAPGDSRAGDPIGALLVRAGKLSGLDLSAALKQQAAAGYNERLGDLLVRKKLVTRADIDSVTRALFEEEISDLLFDKEVEYRFKKDVLPDAHPSGKLPAFGFDIRSILMEATRRQDEWKRIRAAVKSDRAIFTTQSRSTGGWQIELDDDGNVSGRRKISAARNPKVDERILSRWREVDAHFDANPFDGQRSVEEIVALSGLPAFVAMGVIAGLRADGLVRELTAAEVEQAALDHLAAGRHAIAYKLSVWANESDPLRKTGWKLDRHMLAAENLEGNGFRTRTSSLRALQILLRLFGRGAPFRYRAREADREVEVHLTTTTLRVVLTGPRHTHSTARYLKRRKILTREQVRKARQVAKGQSRGLDQVMLACGFIDREEWGLAVKDKMVGAIFSIFGWSEPFVEVKGGQIGLPGKNVESHGLVCEVSLTRRLRRDLRRDLRRWKKLLRQIPSPDLICIGTEPEPTTRRQRRVADLFDGRRTMGDLIQFARVPALDLVRYAADLVAAGELRPLDDREHHEQVEKAEAERRLDDALAFAKSALASGHAPPLYGQRVAELRRKLANRPNPESRPVFKGETSTFSLAEVVQLLHQGKRTGTLKIRSASSDRELTLYMDHGELYVLRVTEEEDPGLSDMLLSDDAPSSLDLASLVKQRGLISESELPPEDLKSVKEDIFDAFLWEGARFEFIQNLLPSELRGDDDRALRLRLRVQPLLMEAISRLTEWDMMRLYLKSSRAIFRFTSPEAKKAAIEAHHGSEAAVYLFDGEHSLADVVRISGENRFHVYRLARELVVKKALELVGKKAVKKRKKKRRRSLLSGGGRRRKKSERPEAVAAALDDEIVALEPKGEGSSKSDARRASSTRRRSSSARGKSEAVEAEAEPPRKRSSSSMRSSRKDKERDKGKSGRSDRSSRRESGRAGKGRKSVRAKKKDRSSKRVRSSRRQRASSEERETSSGSAPVAPEPTTPPGLRRRMRPSASHVESASE